MDDILLQIKNLSIATYKKDSSKNFIKQLINEVEDLHILLNNINLTVFKGEYLGLVGESGSGKSLTVKSVLGMVDINPGIISGDIYITDQENKQINYLLNQSEFISEGLLYDYNHDSYNYEANIKVKNIDSQFFNLLKTEEEDKFILYDSKNIMNQHTLKNKVTLNDILCFNNKFDMLYILTQHKAPSNSQKLILKQVEDIKNKKIAGRLISIILQDPISFLFPYWSINRQIKNLQNLNSNNMSEKELELKLNELLDEIKLNSPEFRNAIPRTLSGGQGQRVMILLAALANPLLLIADEPTTGLDVTLKKIIVEKFRKMRLEKNKDSSMIFISHDINMVRRSTDRIYVMYFGNIVENSKSERFLDTKNHHPYTEKLIKITANHYQEGLRGETEDLDLISKKSGCKYYNKCHLDFKCELCTTILRPPIELDSGEILLNEDPLKEWVKCWAYYKQ